MAKSMHYELAKALFNSPVAAAVKNVASGKAAGKKHPLQQSAQPVHTEAQQFLKKIRKKIKNSKLQRQLSQKGFFAETYFSMYQREVSQRLLALSDANADMAYLCSSEEILEQCLLLFACSPGLSWLFIKNCHYLAEIFPVAQESLSAYRQRLEQELTKLRQEISTAADLAQALRLLKMKEFIRIALNDYMDEDSLETTASKISAFAEAIITTVHSFTRLDAAGIGVIALGKLGGNELNYCSDVDLMFMAEEGTPNRDAEILREIKQFIALIDALQADGRVFHVDLQIRPEGIAGELYLPPSGYLRYYSKRGSPWERQALIKGRFIVGAASLAAAFQAIRAEVIFSQELSSEDMLVAIYRMKKKIETELTATYLGGKQPTATTGNFKLGLGGIRDIEFLVQFLQLHHGRWTSTLSEPNTLQALSKLFNYKILSAHEAVTLTDNYRLLRTTEHRMQLWHLLAIRELPTQEADIAYLAGLCGYHGLRRAKSFLRAYQAALKSTRELFDKIFEHTALFLTKMKTLNQHLRAHIANMSPPQKTAKKTSAPVNNLDNTHLHQYETAWKKELQRFESDYFLHFSTEKIFNHFLLLTTLSPELPVDGTVTLTGKKVTFELVAYSMLGSFSMVAGHISTKGINILNGFIFPQVHERLGGRTSPEHFYRRSFAAWDDAPRREGASVAYKERPVSSIGKIIRGERKKTVIVMEGVFTADEHKERFDVTTFIEELRTYFRLNFKGKIETVREELFLKALPLIEKRKQRPRKPISITIDNDSHLFYTLLRIKSEDIFLFLYQFTVSLSERKFRIAKAEFATAGATIDNVIYITERNRQKVIDSGRLKEIRVALLLLNYFSSYIIFAPNPYLAFSQFSKLIHNIVDDHEAAFAELLRRGKLFKYLARILGTSEAIFEDFFRSEIEEIFQYLSSTQSLKIAHTEASLTQLFKKLLDQSDNSALADLAWGEAFTSVATHPSPILKPPVQRDKKLGLSKKTPSQQKKLQHATQDSLLLLNRFKDSVMFRIDLRFLSGHIKTFALFCKEISLLTDIVLREAYHILEKEQLRKWGLARAPGQAVFLALGKWGGREMGYASDVELMFIYKIDSQLRTLHAKERANNFFVDLGNQLPLAIKSKKSGIFELDFRLRPDGDIAPIAIPFAKFKHYYTPDNPNVRNFERMALTRLRVLVVAEQTEELIKSISQVVKSFIYSAVPFAQEEFLRLRKLQLQEFTHPERINVKFSLGGLVDIEYYVQRRLITAGYYDKKLRKVGSKQANTLLALEMLYKYKHITYDMWQTLQKTYQFYRILINSLRIVRGNAQDLEIPVEKSYEFYYLMRRLKLFNALPQADFMAYLKQELARINALTTPLAVE